jgi:uncharacterized membrane protein YukC
MDMPTLDEAKRSVQAFMDYAEQRDAELDAGTEYSARQRRETAYMVSRETVAAAESLDALFEFLAEAWQLNNEQIAKMLTVEP